MHIPRRSQYWYTRNDASSISPIECYWIGIGSVGLKGRVLIVSFTCRRNWVLSSFFFFTYRLIGIFGYFLSSILSSSRRKSGGRWNRKLIYENVIHTSISSISSTPESDRGSRLPENIIPRGLCKCMCHVCLTSDIFLMKNPSDTMNPRAQIIIKNRRMFLFFSDEDLVGVRVFWGDIIEDIMKQYFRTDRISDLPYYKT